MRVRLNPIEVGLGPVPAGASPGQAFARLGRDVLVAMARAMPDCQSAVLACVVWQAARQQLLRKGPLAGRFVGRLSGPQLVEMTGRPIRTVRHALRRLKESGRIKREATGVGRSAVYIPALRDDVVEE
jgi:hypothetical protein